MSGTSSPEESEEAISQYLQDLGMLEDGMTSRDKQNLWAVIKISQDTAKAEEEDRQEQARQALQFDEVCATDKSSFGSDSGPDGDSEEMAGSSPHESEGAVSEEEKKSAIGAILPQVHAEPMVSVLPSQDAAATNVPILLPYEGDMPQSQNTVNSGSLSVSPCSNSISDFPENQVDSASQDSPSSPRRVVQPSARRCLRSRPNVEIKATEKIRPTNDSFVANTQKPPISGLHDKQRDEFRTVPEMEHVPGSLKSEATHRKTVVANGDTIQVTNSTKKSESCEYLSMPSSPANAVKTTKPTDSDDMDSSVSHVQESSLVSRIHHSLNMSHKKDTKERSNDKPEVNEDCSEENNNSALRQEEIENLGVEKCASVFGTVDNVPSPLSDTLLSDVTSVINCNSSGDVKKKESEDQERNINPFDCDRSNYEQTLKVHKVKRTCSRQPFYIPPYKMDVDTYISYFKRSVSEQISRLVEVQQMNHKCVPWGEPVVVGETSSRMMVNVDKEEQKNKGLANLQGYNFQDHKVTYQQVDNIYEDPDTQSNDDIFFTDNSRRKVVVESQQDVTSDLFDALLEEEKSVQQKEGPGHDGAHNSDNLPAVDKQGTMKRKSESSDDQIFDQVKKSSEPQEKRASPSPWLTEEKGEVPPVAAKRKKLGQVVSSAEPAPSCGDLDGDFEPAKRKKMLRRHRAAVSCTRKKTWINGSSNCSQSIKKDGDVNYEGSIFDDLDSAEGVGDDTNSYPLPCQETAIIKPGPLKLQGKGRRLFHHNQFDVDKHGATEYKENDATAVDDITVVYDVENSCIEQDTELIPCPICRKTFATKDIEAHASECSEYCEEELQPDELHVSNSSSQKVKQSSEGSVSEKHWNEFNSEKRFEGEDSSTGQTRQQRPQTCQGTSKHTSA